MSILTFIGGVHPYDGKDISKDEPICEYNPKGEVTIALSQHIGAPATPIVKPGDKVLAGQMIAQASGFVSANVHSSVSGTVKAIEPRVLVNGIKSSCIIIDNDCKFQEVSPQNVKALEKLTKEEIIALIKEAGVVGMGGAGFPTHVKLSPKNADDIEYIIVNGSECEPYLTSDYRKMIESPEALIAGLKVMLKLFDKAKGYIAIEDNKPEAIAKLRTLVKDEERIEVKKLYTKYPQGAERMLIHAVTGRKINSSMLPADALCIVDNVDTVLAIKCAVLDGRPLTKRVVTVTGDAIAKPRNYLVRIGTNQTELIEAAGGYIKQPEKIISGGPMMGVAISTTDTMVTKTTSALLCYQKDELTSLEETHCINCGRCAGVCPGQILPSKLAVFAARGDKESFVHYNGMECCECGCCSYICPAKKNLTQSIKSMRKEILADRKK